MTVERNIILYTGSLLSEIWTANNQDGSIADLTQYTALYGQIRRHPGAIVAFDLAVSTEGDPTLGQVMIEMLPDDTSSITGSYVDHYIYDVVGVDDTGDIITTLFLGSVFVNRSVTNTP